MHCLLVPMGTPGDVQPFFDLGCALRERGHRVTLLAHEPFRARAERLQLGFESIGTSTDFERLLNHRHLWDPMKAHRVFAKYLVLPTMRPMVEAIRSHLSSETVVFAQSMALGARIAQDRFGARTITVHRQPSFLRSLHDTSKSPAMFVPPWAPRMLKQAQFRAVDAFLDRPYLPGINEYRLELGLSPVERWSKSWLNSPDAVVGFWNDWFAPPQQDWPANVTLAGFIADEVEEEPAGEALRQFLEAGEPPIVFTFGSGNKFAGHLLSVSAEACHALGRRGILLSRLSRPFHILPPNVIHLNYAPFTWLLPRCAATVHHAGIGTVGQTLAAGIPQLSVAGLAFDTVDTAHRLKKLGLGREISIGRYSVTRATGALARLLEDQAILARAKSRAGLVQRSYALERACQVAEQLVRSGPKETAEVVRADELPH